MFDVIWTDANRERVGDRRARKGAEKEKEREKDERSNGDKRSSGRASISTRSSLSSAEKPFAFFGSGKKHKQSTDKSKASFSSGLRLSSSQGDAQSERESLPVTPVSTNIPISVQSTTGGFSPVRSLNSGEASPAHSSRGKLKAVRSFSPKSLNSSVTAFLQSVFSDWDQGYVVTGSFGGPSIYNAGGETAHVQALSSPSHSTKSTDVTLEPQSLEADIENLISDIAISAEPQPEQVEVTISQDSGFTPSPLKLKDRAHSRSINPGIPRRRPNFLTVDPQQGRTKFLAHQPSAWKPPDEWACDANQLINAVSNQIHPPNIREFIQPTEEEDDSSLCLDLSVMQREVNRMAAADSEFILQRLKEEWPSSFDASWYKEMEMERKRYMLSALHNMETIEEASQIGCISRTVPKVQKILALYDTAATASYIAAVNHNCPVYHLSPTPLSHKLFPNVHPILSPTTSFATISVAPQTFSSVHCLSLPSLLPASDIPVLLQSIHRCLVPGGALQLTLMDPSPVASTLGPRMRTWIDDNLLLNLQRQFRCTNPSKILPEWLADQNLRAAGSVITTTKFRAIAPEARTENDSVTSRDSRGSRRESDLKAELRSLVGRMLWTEIWGQFVTADDWWWDDPDCVEECLAMDTHWTYSLIEAVKGE